MNDELGERMKCYENQSKSFLLKRTPAILRIDGRAFHTFTKGFNYPFDEILSMCMRMAAIEVLKDCSTGILAYGQSDEVSILMIDYRGLQTNQWFGGNIQKIVSIVASEFTSSFNSMLYDILNQLNSSEFSNKDYYEKIRTKLFRANFDARVFSIPESDISNYFYWRHKDCIRNSVTMAASLVFSHKELHGKKTEEKREMLRCNGKQSWENMNEVFKNGYLIDIKGEDLDITDIRKTITQQIQKHLNSKEI